VSNRENSSRLLRFLPLVLAVGVALFVRIRLLPIPLERDEGEFAYIGQLLLKGIAPFTHAYTMKLPGVSAMYALFMLLFGQSSTAIHAGLLLVNLGTIALLFLLARRLFDTETAVAAAASYALLSLGEAVNGVHAHATHFVVLFALAGLLLLLRSFDRASLPAVFGAGLCLGASFLMKQHAVALIAFAAVYLLWRHWRDRTRMVKPGLLFLGALALPYLVTLLLAAKAGALKQFQLWTINYPREYVSEQTLAHAVGAFTATFADLLYTQLPFWLLAGAGCFLLHSRKGRCNDRWFVTGFVVCSFLATCPGFYFRPHYFILLAPAAALAAGAAAAPLGSARGLVTVPLLVIAIGYCAYFDKEYFFTLSPGEVTRYTYQENPFPEALPVGRYLKEHTSPDDSIAVLGSEPEIYFYADRPSATGHIYMYGLMENQRFAEQMQRQMMSEIEKARPKYLVFVHVKKSWMGEPAGTDLLRPWLEQFLGGYEVAGVTDIVSSTTTRYLWGAETAGYTPASNAYLAIYKRKGAV
jgi:hypothetical protein